MAKKKYEAQNRIEGLGKKPLETGEIVEMEEKEAEALVAGGSLKPTGPAPKEPDQG